jgi:hypothetical protein
MMLGLNVRLMKEPYNEYKSIKHDQLNIIKYHKVGQR